MAGVTLEMFQPDDQGAWRSWLARNHATSPGVRLVLFKKHAGDKGLTYEEAMEEAIAFGWIDSKGGRLDGERFVLQFTPRRVGSEWSRSNKERVKRLVVEGRMAEPGLAKVEAAKRDGSWTALDDVEDLVIAADLARALDASPEARAGFEALSPSAKKMTLYHIYSAKRSDTRARRIDQAVRRAAESARE